jgi:type III secretion protein C
MKEENLFKRFLGSRRTFFFRFSLAALSLFPGNLHELFAEEEVSTVDFDFFGKEEETDSYKINFNNVPIVEYIRFISKITGTNFVFDEEELQFNVTIVSEEPITTKNVMSALIQVLRIHGLSLLEQENNLLITRNTAVNQIPTIISAELPNGKKEKAPLVTRIFRIKNANPGNIAGLIRPMVSASALIEVSNETHQLIVTDVTTNVDKIASLLVSLDTPHSPLEIETYVAKHITPSELISLGTQIVSPFAEGHPLLFVPQIDTSTIFIVSTPYLIERAMSVLEDLDVPLKASRFASDNFFVYNILYATQEQIEEAFKQMVDNLKKTSVPDVDLIESMKSMRWIKETNSLVFTGTQKSLDQIKELLLSFDVTPSQSKRALASSSNFLMYKPKNRSGNDLEEGMKEIGKRLGDSGLADPTFLKSIEKMKWVPSTNTLLFTGDSETLKRIQEMVSEIDLPMETYGLEVFLYKPKFASKDELEDALERLSDNLDTSTPQDKHLAQTINAMKWMSDTQSFLFKGDTTTITRLKDLLAKMDNPEGLTGEGVYGFYLYKLQNTQGDIVLKNLEKIAEDLPSKDGSHASLIKTIEQTKWIKENNSLLISGTAASIEKVKELISQFDLAGVGALGAGGKSSFFIYKPAHQNAEYIESSLKTVAKDLEESGLIDPDLLQTLNSLKYASSTNSILFTGTPDALQKVQDLLTTIDVITPELSIQRIGKLTFLIYKLEHVSAPQFMSSLRSVAGELDKSNVLDKELGQTINSMKWIKETNSILFTGTPQALERVELLIKKFDITGISAEKASPLSYILYSPKYVNGPDLISILCDFEKNLIDSGITDQALFESIGNLKWMEQTYSLVITGDADSIKKVEALLLKFDVPNASSAGLPSIDSIVDTNFLVYKLQYHQGSDIIAAIKQVAGELGKSVSTQTQGLVDAISSLQWINVTNSLIATGDQDVLTKLRDLIENLDVPLKQVFIEVLILETSLSNLQNFGLQWGSLFKYKERLAMGTGSFPSANPFSGAPASTALAPGLRRVNASTFPNPQTDIPFTQGFDLGSIGDLIFHKGRSFLSLGALVSALQSDADSTIVMNPKIITQDTNNSTIFVGQNIPYTGSTQNIQGAANSTTSNIEYRDIGMNLSITPYLGNGDIVTLEISHDLSVQIQPAAGFTIPANSILTTHTSLNTRVHVPDQHFVVLSGMIQDTKQHFTSGIPCLGGLPVIGAAFSENDRANSKDNIVIFIRPQIIHNFDEYKKITEHQEQLYKNEAVIPRLKEEFDEGLNLVKQPDNE